MSLTLNQYQEKAGVYAKYNSVHEYPFLALAEEAGEVMGKVAKCCRKTGATAGTVIWCAGNPDSVGDVGKLREDLIKELGDTFWQLQQCCTELNISLEEAAYGNLSKLAGRAERGTIVGEGDER